MKWQVKDIVIDDVRRRFHVSGLLGKVIAASPLTDGQIGELLDPPALTTSKADCVKRCCRRIQAAEEKGEKVFIFGDYDADGISATAIMKKTLDSLGVSNGYYIPDRLREGYGLTAETIEKAHAKGYKLVITVDNGVSAASAIIRAKQLGMDVIVTDHHEYDRDPGCDTLVHPSLMEDEYAYLCGAGVALEISRNLIGDDDELTALAAVASIGDVMPMWKQTRAIVQSGLAVLRSGRPMPLYALLKPGSDIDDTAVSFQIVPKLNALGRLSDMGNVNTLVPFLLCHNPANIAFYARQLDALNEQRKKLSGEETARAEKMIDDEPFQIIYNEAFHEGICGLIASRLAASCGKPVLVFTRKGDLIKGSGRSVDGFNMFAFLANYNRTVSFGGHEQAVGITIKEEDYPSLCRYIKTRMEQVDIVCPEVTNTAIRITPEEITAENVKALSLLNPYPRELVPPYFALADLRIASVYENEKILKYRFTDSPEPFEAVVYKRKNLPIVNEPKCLIGSLALNYFRGSQTVQMTVDDMA